MTAISIPFVTRRAPRQYPDIRQILADNAIRDMLAEDDERLIAAINVVLRPADRIAFAP